jgi:polysaccharide biosynthesis/export protein ExoF
MNVRRFIRGAATAFGIFLALSVGSVAVTQEYLVQPDDKLKIKVYQIPELAGEYVVSPSGTLSIAPVGSISVAGLSVEEVASRLSEYLIKKGHSQRPGVSVEVVQVRPVYVVGDVQRPGEYPYRPGLSVLQAITLAGGYYRFSDPGLMRLERDLISSRGDFNAMSKKLIALRARRARLSAELDGSTDIAFPPDLVKDSEKENSVKQLLREELSLLALNRESLRQQLESLDRAINLYEREIKTIEKQAEAEKLQLEAVQRELAEVKVLTTKGLATMPRQTSLERTQAQIMSAEQGLQALILRARQSITAAEQRRFDLQNERRAKLNSELQQLRLDIEDVQSKIEIARDLIIEAETTAPDAMRKRAETSGARDLIIVRMVDGRSTPLVAREEMALQPGDVLRAGPLQSSFGPVTIGAGRTRPTQ